MSYGVTAAGFNKKTYAVIWAELTAAARSAFGADVDLSQYSAIGIFLQLMADQLRETWDNMEDVYYSTYLGTADGTTLEKVVALAGITRRPATQSLVTLTFTGSIASSIPVGTKVQTAQGVEFITTELGTIPAGLTVDVEARAMVAGTAGNVADATITEINNPISGITAVTNALAAVGGAAIETDAELRLRYQERGASGGSTTQAIQAALNNIDSVVTAVCYENTTDGSVDGMPPHSIETVVDGGTNAEVLDCLLNNKPAGIETCGGESGSVVDSAGVTRTFSFSRPTYLDIWVDIQIVTNSDWSADFIDAVKEKVVQEIGGTYGVIDYPGQGIGVDVYAWKIIVNLDSIPGIESVSVVVGSASPPNAPKVDMGRAQRGNTDTTKITVTTS